MQRFVKEPLLHFALIGVALFAAYAWLNDERSPHTPSNVIHVTSVDRDWLSEMWVRQWRRPPSENELQDLLVAHVKEQLLYREALALKLDDQDVVVRRRLAQKMDFLLEDEVAPGEPSEAELQDLYREQLERFRTEPRVSFVHVYYSRDRRGAAARMDAQRALDEWRRSQRSPVGDPWVLDDHIEGQDRRSVSEQFGKDFTEQVFTLSNEQWAGPVESTYGVHLVRIERREEGAVRPFADVRADLIAEHRRLSRERVRQRHVAALLKKYEIRAVEDVRPFLAPLLTGKERVE